MAYNKILIPTAKEQIYVNPGQLIYCKARHQWSVIKTEEGILHEVPLILKKLHQRIDRPYFVRTHHSFLVNINYIDKIIGNFELLELSTQEQIPVSRNKRPEVRNILGSQNSI